MRLRAWLGVALGALTVGCAPDSTTTSGERPNFAHVPDLTGLPDIVVDGPTLAHSWVVYDETFEPTACDVIESPPGEGLTAGEHRTLRVTVNTPNVGTADLHVGDPNAHVAANDGLFEFATCHHHYHFRHYATYELIALDTDGNEVGSPLIAAKRGFCMIDVAPFNSDATPPKAWVYRSCGAVGRAGNQGIATGWADQYYKWLPGQFFVIDGLPPGPYKIRIHVNPGFVQGPDDPGCPALDPHGLCHQIAELDYDNNIAEVVITIPDGRPGKVGYGAGAGQQLPNNVHQLLDDENRPTK
jgi:hypothetical protein